MEILTQFQKKNFCCFYWNQNSLKEISILTSIKFNQKAIKKIEDQDISSLLQVKATSDFTTLNEDQKKVLYGLVQDDAWEKNLTTVLKDKVKNKEPTTNKADLIGGLVGGGVVLFLLTAFAIWFWKKKSQKNSSKITK